MKNLFCEGLIENDVSKLLMVPKSDLHNHSGKGCTRAWLEERLKMKFPNPPKRFDGVTGMHDWFTDTIKPYCGGAEGLTLRWEGAFAEAKRNNIKRLSMNFDVSVIDQVGGMDAFVRIINEYHDRYCPDMVFEPELTYPSFCDVAQEAAGIDDYISDGFFKSIDVCGGENVQPFDAFLPMYRKAEKYQLIKRMHVGETGPAEDVKKAVEILGLHEIHHGINAATSPEVMAFLADNNIQLNVCPSSNVKLQYVTDYKDHPIKILYENGVRVTINTDDLLLFDSTIENEYLLLYRAGILSAGQLNDIRETGLNPAGPNMHL